MAVAVVQINRAQPVMRLAHCVGQYRPRGVALIGAGERDPERHLDASEVVARLVADLVRVDKHLEPVWFSPA